MPVHVGPPATSDPNDDAVLVGHWLGGSQLAELKAVTPSAARAALARLRKSNFAGVHPILVNAIAQLLLNPPPPRRRGRPPEPLHKAAIAQFIRDRVRVSQSWGERPRYRGTDKAIEAAMAEFGIGRDYAYEIWKADRDTSRIVVPEFAALVPIGQSPNTWSPERRARVEEVGRLLLAEKRRRRRR